MKGLKIYLAHPINGLSYDEVMKYYDDEGRMLTDWGYIALCPMTGKSYLRNEKEFRVHGYDNPTSTNHAIIERDRWMVEYSDIVFVNLENVVSPSIGCTMELAWAFQLHKHTILVLKKDSPLYHAFMIEAADILFETTEEANKYLQDLSNNT